MNLAENATAYREGQHPGYEQTALDGLVESIDLIHKTGAKVVINGGSLNPAGLAEKCRELVRRDPSDSVARLTLLILVFISLDLLSRI